MSNKDPKNSAPAPTPVAAPETTTKISKVRAMFARKASWTRAEIAEEAGYDLNNAAMAMSILKNPARTKNMLVTSYNRETKTYSLVPPTEAPASRTQAPETNIA